MRDEGLGRFLTAAKAALAASGGDAHADAAVRRVFGRLEREASSGAVTAARLPVCDWLEPALDAAAPGPRGAVAEAMEGLADRLEWKRRASARPEDAVFWNGHANAMIVGPGGLEDRTDLWIGVTLMAPHVTYVDHDHPPEEVYLSLSPGEWWNETMDWTDPGMDGLVYNPPGILHAMRSGAQPFLALWFLPV